MYNHAKIVLFTLLTGLGLICCNSAGDGNKLASIAAVIKDYKSRIIELEKLSDESTDLVEAYNYAATAKKLRKEADVELNAAFASMPRPVVLPVDQNSLSGKFVLSGVDIVTVSLDSVLLTAVVKNIGDGCPNNSFCLCAIDESGTMIKPDIVFGEKGIRTGNQLKISGVIKNPEDYSEFSRFVWNPEYHD